MHRGMQSEPESSKLLLDAVERGDTARVRSLLDQGADPNAYVDRTERLATVESVAADRLVDVTRRETALDLAARCGRRAVAELLLERGAHVTAATLGHAVHAMDQDLIRRLLGAGADPNALVWTTDTVLENEYLPPGGDYVTVHLRAPVVTAASRLPDPAPFLLLVAGGGRAGKAEISRVLRRAFGSGDVTVVGVVVVAGERLGVTVDPIDVIGQELAVVRFLLERRWQLHPESATPERRRAELTPLLMKAAILYGNRHAKERPRLMETAHYLIAQGADPDFFDPHFRIREIPHKGRDPGLSPISPLHEALRALRAPDPGMVKLLLEHGARTTFVFADGRRETALDVAKRTLAPQFVPRMAEILRPFEEARAKEGR
jgi:ankyrin repeat protein